MNKHDFIERVASKGYTKKDASCIITDVITSIMETLAEGESVTFHGFGTFSIRESLPREGIDYQTKERVTFPGHKAPKFAPGKLLKRAVREGILRE